MKNSWPDVFVSQSVSQYVCSSIFGNSARTAGLIGTGVAPFNAPKRRNDDGACMGRLVARDICHRVKACKKIRGPLEVKRRDTPNPNLRVTCVSTSGR